MFMNSASELGFSIRAVTWALASGVSVDKPDRAVETVVLDPVGAVLTLHDVGPRGTGSRCASGMASQLVEWWKVPRFKSWSNPLKVGSSTPVTPSPTLVDT